MAEKITWYDGCARPCQSLEEDDINKWIRTHKNFYAKHGRSRRILFEERSDVFNPKEWSWRAKQFSTIESMPSLTWIVSTKIASNVKAMVPVSWLEPGGWPANVEICAQASNQHDMDEAFNHLSCLPCKVTLLLTRMRERIDLEKWQQHGHLHHVVVCGDRNVSGTPMLPDWIRSLRDQCARAQIAFFFEGWGRWEPAEPIPGKNLGGEMNRGTVRLVHAQGNPEGFFRRGDAFMRVNNRRINRLLDGVEHTSIPSQIT